MRKQSSSAGGRLGADIIVLSLVSLERYCEVTVNRNLGKGPSPQEEDSPVSQVKKNRCRYDCQNEALSP